MADSGHPPAELHERLLICRTIKLNAGAHGGHRRCCHAQMQKNAQNKPQMARLILCVHTTLQVYCNLFLTFCPHCLQHSAETVTFFIIPPYLTVPPSFPPLCRPGRPAKSRAPRSSGALCRCYFPFRFLAKAAFFRGDIFPFCASGFAVGVPRRPRLPEASFFRRGCLSGLSGFSGLTGG